jgi:hypothetical protein
VSESSEENSILSPAGADATKKAAIPAPSRSATNGLEEQYGIIGTVKL